MKNNVVVMCDDIGPMRIQKFIASLGIASRREVERWVREKRVVVNGEIAQAGHSVCETDLIRVDGNLIKGSEPPKVYWLFNKPDQTITSRSDELGRTTIFDLPSFKDLTFRVNPVGRLDYRTEGLLLLTNDGQLSNSLCHPSSGVHRHYQVWSDQKLTARQLQEMRAGISLSDGLAKCKIAFIQGVNLGRSKGAVYHITVFEGRNRLVRRMFEHFDLKVVRLIRVGFGDLWISESLAPGSYRQLSRGEISKLKSAVTFPHPRG